MNPVAGSDLHSFHGPPDRMEIQRELISQLYRSALLTLASSFGAACLLSYVLWVSAEPEGLWAWYAVVVLVTLLRFVHVRRVLARGVSVASAREDERLFAIGSLAAGVIWGCSIVQSVQLAPATELLVVPCVMAALSTSAIVSYTRSLRSFAGFVIPSMTPYAVRLIWPDGVFEPMMAGFMVFWSVLLWVAARHLNRGHRNRIELALNNAQLIEILTSARDRAESASLAKTRFLANMSHELRTPLNAILGYAQMMDERILGPQDFGKYGDYPSIVVRSGKHLLQIVDRILDVSKLEAGAVDLSEDLIDVENLIEGAIKFVVPSAERGGVELDWRPPEQLPCLRGDATKIRQILLNLLSNAVKFTPRGGRVTVSSRNTKDGRMEIRVSDTGIGMSPEDLENALVPFARLESREHMQRLHEFDEDSEFSHTGLELPLVKLLCDLHDAEFRLTSTLGTGTNARVSFPRARVILDTNVTAFRAAS